MLPAGGSYSAAIAAEYLETLRDIPSFALEKAIQDYRLGNVGEVQWMPHPAEIRRHALAIAAEENKLAKIKQAEREEARNVARFARGLPVRTPEEIARMVKLSDEAKAAIMQATAKEAKVAGAREARFQRLMEKHDEIFAEEMQRVRAYHFKAEPGI